MIKHAVIVGLSMTVLHLLFNKEQPASSKPPAPKFWLYTKDPNIVFFSLERILLKLGLEKLPVYQASTVIQTDWDLLWTFEYGLNVLEPAGLNFSNLKAHQRINYIPGNYYLTSKDILAINTDSKYVAKGFYNSKDLQEYAKKHPGTRFVIKNKKNRGVMLKKVSEIEFTQADEKGFFAQAFIENPFLIAGHKFDFAVYVLITSVDPLRVYYYSKPTTCGSVRCHTILKASRTWTLMLSVSHTSLAWNFPTSTTTSTSLLQPKLGSTFTWKIAVTTQTTS